MNLTLPPDLEDLIARKLASGDYATPADLFREALGLLLSRDRTQDERLVELRREVAIGIEQAERGATLPLDVDALLIEARRRRDANNT